MTTTCMFNCCNLDIYCAKRFLFMVHPQDYGIDFDDHDHPIKPFLCRCGSKFCRNIRRPISKYPLRQLFFEPSTLN